MKTLKVIGVNLLIFTIFALIIELCFGGWIFTRNNMQSLNIFHSRSTYYNVKGLYDDTTTVIKYSRDQFGLRGGVAEHPEKIEILTMGGSTTDQIYVEDGKTWQDYLQKGLRERGLPLTVSNAGVDGQSTYGHIKNFELWFPNIPNLKPKYILFYVGLNDMYTDETKNSNFAYDELNNKTLKNKIKNLSALYNLYRKIHGSFMSRKVKIDHGKEQFERYTYVSKALNDSVTYAKILAIKIPKYKERIRMLAELSQGLGAQPIFLTQPCRKFKYDAQGGIVGISEISAFGAHQINGVDFYHLLNGMNQAVEQVCQEKQLVMIELTNLSIWEDEDFYDFVHMTPQGTSKLGLQLAEKLANILR